MKKALRILLSMIIFVVLGIAFYVICILFIFDNPIGQFKNAREADKMAKLQYFLDIKNDKHFAVASIPEKHGEEYIYHVDEKDDLYNMVLEFNFVEKEPTANEEIKGLYDFGYLAKYGVWHPSDISFCVLTNGFIEISARAGTEYYNKTKNRYYYLEAEEYELFVKKIQYTLEYCEICNVQ